MGKVFSWQQVSKRSVPSTEDFLDVSCYLDDRIKESDQVLCALKLGSVLRNDFNARSDLDYLVIYSSEHRLLAMKLFGDFIDYASRHNVPLGLIPISEIASTQSLHSITRYFSGHMRWSAEHDGAIKGNPIETISLDHLHSSLNMEVGDYLRNRLLTLEKLSIEMARCSNSISNEHLSKAMGIPVHVARQMLWMKGEDRGEGSKSVVCDAYRELFPGELADILAQLVTADGHYTEELNKQLVRQDEGTYRQALGILADLIPFIYEFTEKNALLTI